MGALLDIDAIVGEFANAFECLAGEFLGVVVAQDLSCDEILYKHPAFDLLYQTESDESIVPF